MSAVEERAGTVIPGMVLAPGKKGFYTLLRIDDISVSSNVRKVFDEVKLRELADSIKEYGVLQPLVVRMIEDPTGQGRGTAYVLVAGERRLRAAKLAGLREVPCRLVDLTAKQAAEIQLLENLQREDLNPTEEAEALANLITEHGYTQQMLAKKLGKSQSWVSQRLALLDLSDDAKALISRGIIKASHAEVLKIYEKTAPLAVEKVVKEMAESGKAVPVVDLAEEIEDRVRWYQKVIQGEGYTGPRFDITPCFTCQKTSRIKNLHAGENGLRDDATVLYCADEKCYAKKERAALRAEEQAFLETRPGSVLLSGKQYGSYEQFYLDDRYPVAEKHKARLAECRAENCPHLKEGYYRIDPMAKSVAVCLNPECWKKKQEHENRAKEDAVRKERDRKLSAWSRLKVVEEVRSAIAALPERVRVWVVGNLLLDALSSVRWQLGGEMWASAAAKVIGWPERDFAPGLLRDQHWGKFAQHLEALPGERLVELIDIIAACHFASGRAPSLDYLAGLEVGRPVPEVDIVAAMEELDHEGEDEPEERSDPLGRQDQQADCVVV